MNKTSNQFNIKTITTNLEREHIIEEQVKQFISNSTQLLQINMDYRVYKHNYIKTTTTNSI